MSATAIRNTRTRNALISRLNASEAECDILDYLNGCYDSRTWELTQDEADAIAANPGNHDDLMARLTREGKSAGARYIAARINSGASPNLGQLAQDWWCHRAIKQELSLDELKEISASVMDLRMLGVKTGYQARRFYNLYREVMVKDRVWGSSKQVNQVKVLAIASTANYNRLPLWAKKGLIEHAPYVPTEGRIGDIWRLLPCIRAWKWNSALPKGIAEKVGKLSPRMRVLAGLAWDNPTVYALHEQGWSETKWNEYGYEQVELSRQEIINQFWGNLQQLSKSSILVLLPELMQKYGGGQLQNVVELLLGLPYKSLEEEWEEGDRLPPGYDRYTPSEERITEIIATYGNPKDACGHLFGVNGKATVKAFQQCQSKDLWKWAAALAHGNPDAVQKILTMETAIAFEKDAVNFLLSLPMVSRLRMLQATEFKCRGQVQPISPDHVRDTGYLWSNIQNKPELGRVRCWFSVHETLAAAFVKELPDEVLPIPDGWERVDGLCAVDGSWELEFPKRVATLKYWGQLLNNCVGGYGNAIKSGRSVIFVVREYGQITHCVEICGSSVNQFYQSGNRSGDRAIQESVEAALRQAGLL